MIPKSEDLPDTGCLHRLRTMAGVRTSGETPEVSFEKSSLIVLSTCRYYLTGFFIFHTIMMKNDRFDCFFINPHTKEKQMNKKQKRILMLTAVLALTFGTALNVNAMHIMEGYLPGGYCIAWGALCIPFLAAGFFSIKKTLNEHRNLITLLAMSGAFIFVISSLKIPSLTGSCSHMTGTGLGAILFGPAAVSILGLIVLLFQAIILAHGGLTTIGANTFSMAIAGPFVSYGIFVLCKKLKVNRRFSIFLAAMLGDLFTYIVTAGQLALAHHADTSLGGALLEFLTIFAPTQIPLAIIEGLLTMLIVMGLETYAGPELRTIKLFKEDK